MIHPVFLQLILLITNALCRNFELNDSYVLVITSKQIIYSNIVGDGNWFVEPSGPMFLTLYVNLLYQIRCQMLSHMFPIINLTCISNTY